MGNDLEADLLGCYVLNLNARPECLFLSTSSSNAKVFQINGKHLISFSKVWPSSMFVLAYCIDSCFQTGLYEGEVSILSLKDSR